MTTDFDDVTTERAFEDALRELLSAAHENEIPVRGGWELRNDGDDIPDWDVVITAVEKPPLATEDED